MRPDDRALDVECPRCRAAVGMPCMFTLTTARTKRVLERKTPHPERTALARESSVNVAPSTCADGSRNTDDSRGRTVASEDE